MGGAPRGWRHFFSCFYDSFEDLVINQQLLKFITCICVVLTLFHLMQAKCLDTLIMSIHCGKHKISTLSVFLSAFVTVYLSACLPSFLTVCQSVSLSVLSV